MLERILHKLSTLPLHTRVLLSVATAMFCIELFLRHVAPRSRAYARWTAGVKTIGSVWTAVLLSIVYFLSIALVSLILRLLRKDPLDRRLGAEASYWRLHEGSPLGPLAAARHQF